MHCPIKTVEKRSIPVEIRPFLCPKIDDVKSYIIFPVFSTPNAAVCLSRKMLTSIIEAARNAALGKVHCEPATEKCPPLVTGRQIAAASAIAAQGDSCEFGSTKYYALCCLGGTLSCGLTHTMVVPLDLVKCRLQVDKAKYKNLITGFKISVKEEGMRGLAKGWAPTLWGYSAQVRR